MHRTVRVTQEAVNFAAEKNAMRVTFLQSRGDNFIAASVRGEG